MFIQVMIRRKQENVHKWTSIYTVTRILRNDEQIGVKKCLYDSWSEEKQNNVHKIPTR